MIQSMTENDKIVRRNIDDGALQRSALPVLARQIVEAVHAAAPTGAAL